MVITKITSNRRFEQLLVLFFIITPPLGGLMVLANALNDFSKFGKTVGLLAYFMLLVGAHIKYVRPYFRRFPVVRGYKEILEVSTPMKTRHPKLVASVMRSRLLRSCYRIGFTLLSAPFFVGQTMLHGSHFLWFFFGWLVTGFGITVGYHRVGTHPSFKAPTWVRATLLAMGSMAMQGPCGEWMKKHSKHHAFGETSADTHSPYVFEDTKRGIFIEQLNSFLHSFVMWAFREPSLMRPRGISLEAWKQQLLTKTPDAKTFRYRDEDRNHWELRDKADNIITDTQTLINKRWAKLVDTLMIIEADKTVKILSNPIVYLALVAVSVFAPLVLGNISVWEALARICFTNWATFCVNSVSHIWGEQPFVTPDNSRNNAVVEIIALGEGGHNTHHKSELWAQHGIFAWQFDPSAHLIKGLRAIGLASNLNIPPRSQIKQAWRKWRQREPGMQGYPIPASFKVKPDTEVAASIRAEIEKEAVNLR
jgi:stearoyl-CoA desaturase (Delta-9 desaturase)